MNDETAPRPETGNGRKKMLVKAAAVVAAAAVAAGGWWLFAGRFAETTDNAYVEGELVAVTPQTSGTVVKIVADRTDYVKRGDPLVVLGTTDAGIALDRAVARLATAVRSAAAKGEQVARWEAEVALREAVAANAGAEYRRRKDLHRTGAVSDEEFQQSETDAVIAARSLAVARRRLAEAELAAGDGPVEGRPEVVEAAAAVREAWLARARATVVSPVNGYVARRGIRLGERAEPGKPVMAVVAEEPMWVVANFKESQLRHMRAGQPATLTADLYGSGVSFEGEVAGIVAGTGALFSLLPPQNATGNWIKVVQRVPVKIRLTGERRRPLLLGLSMRVTVDTTDREGQVLAPAADDRPEPARLDVYDGQIAGADELIAETVAANLPPAGEGAEGA